MLASGPALGFALGWIFSGDPRRLAALRIRWWPLLVLGVLLRLAAGTMGEAAALLYVLGFFAVTVVATVNAALPGMALIAVGAALNLVVVAANGGMPVDPAAVVAAGARMPVDPLHLERTGSTHLAVLADIIPAPPFGAVYSAGDFLLASGGFWLPFRWLRRR